MNRSSAISLLLVFAAGPTCLECKADQRESGSRPQFQVRIYNYAQVLPETMLEAKKAASVIFQRAGLEVCWLDHSFDGISGESTLNSDYPVFQLRVLTRQMTERLPAVSKHMTGLTFQGTSGHPGRVASVFYHRVEELAKAEICSKGQILGYAAAHELGHLLLGNIDHSSTGLMKAKLGHKDLQTAARGDLVFTEEQAVLIRWAVSGW
jgi:hypothetical protein